MLRSNFLLPLDKVGAGLFPVTVSHVMVSLSNHARVLHLELFTKASIVETGICLAGS
jgi:hypothetical protein